MNLHTLNLTEAGLWLDAHGQYHTIATMSDRHLLNVLGRFLPAHYLNRRRSAERETMLRAVVREVIRRQLPLDFHWRNYQ